MISQKELQALLNYNPDTGVFTWKNDRGGTAKKNSIAGSTTPKGYITIRVKMKSYLAHRLAWLYIHGYMPKIIDHAIKNDPALGHFNNRISNLRPATKSQNQANRPKNKNNTSGYKGVSWSKFHKKWVAQCNGKYLGLFSCKQEAFVAYNKAADNLQKEFAFKD